MVRRGSSVRVRSAASRETPLGFPAAIWRSLRRRRYWAAMSLRGCFANQAVACKGCWLSVVLAVVVAGCGQNQDQEFAKAYKQLRPALVQFEADARKSSNPPPHAPAAELAPEWKRLSDRPLHRL